MGARYVRKEMDCPTVKLKDLKVGVIAECDGEIIMKVCSNDYKFHFYNFTEGSKEKSKLLLREERNIDSAYATMLVTEYTGSIIIKNE